MKTSRTDIIEERGGEFFILTEEGEELEGPIASEAEAKERLRQIEAAKAARGKGGAGKPGSHERLWKPDHVDSVRRYDYLEPLHCDKHRPDGILMTETPEGFLKADARPARVGVQTYQDAHGNSWGEFRSAGEVFSQDSLRSFDLATITDDHPADFVSASNVKDVQVGTVGSDAKRDGRFVRASIVITDSNVIRAIKDGKRDLSCGYTAQVISDQGTTDDGVSFAARQTNIRINHVAVVSKGRAGPECAVLGRGDAFNHTHEVIMKTKTIKIGDAEFTVPEAVADAYEAKAKTDADAIGTDTIKQLQDAGALDAKGKVPPAFLKNIKGKGKEEEEEEDKGKSKDSASELRAKVDTLEAQAKAHADSFNTRVDARSKLVTNAVLVLGATHKTDGIADAQLMREVVLKVLPSMEPKLDANKGDSGYLLATYDQAMDLHARRDQATLDNNSAIYDAMNNGAADPFTDALTKYAKRGKPTVEA